MDPFNVTNVSSSSSSGSEEGTPSNTTEGVIVSSPTGTSLNGQMIILSAFLVAFATAGAIANFLVILSYKFEKKLRGNFQILIRNQAVADLAVCAVVIPSISVHVALGYWPFGRVWCGFTLLFDYGGCAASVIALVVICIDRLWATKWCHNYRKYNTRKKSAIMCLFVWLMTAGFVGYPVISDRVLRWTDGKCHFYVKYNQEYLQAYAILIVYIPSVLIIVLYSIVLYAIRKIGKTRPGEILVSAPRHQEAPRATAVAQQPGGQHSTGDTGDRGTTQTATQESTAGCEKVNATSAQQGTSHAGECSENAKSEGTKLGQEEKAGNGKQQEVGSAENETPGQKTKKNRSDGKAQSTKKGRKSFITLTYIVLAYVICWWPWAVLYNVVIVYPDVQGSDLYWGIAWLTYVNSGLNPFLYACSNADFRSTVVKMLKFVYCKLSY